MSTHDNPNSKSLELVKSEEEKERERERELSVFKVIYTQALNELQILKGSELNIFEGSTLRAITDDIFYTFKNKFPRVFKKILNGRHGGIISKILDTFFQRELEIGFYELPEIDKSKTNAEFHTVDGPLTVAQLRVLWRRYEREKEML